VAWFAAVARPLLRKPKSQSVFRPSKASPKGLAVAEPFWSAIHFSDLQSQLSTQGLIMNLNKVSMGVLALCSLAASPAFALTASTYSAANAMTVYVSGATAMDVGLENAALALCNPGTAHKYTITNQFVYLCTANPAKITISGGRTQLAVHKHSPGGSGNGVAPVNNSTPLPFLDLVKIASSCAAATGAATSIACTETSGLTTNAVAPLGISDMEPQFFGAAAGTYNNLLIEPLATVIFGMPVTTAAYQALQAAQGLTVGATDAANIPSLSQAQVTSMFTQEGQSWSALTGAVLADDNVYVARRASTSGTQKTYEAVIAKTVNSTPAGKSCYAGLPAFLSGPDVSTNAAATAACDGSNLIVNNSGSQQVNVCLVAHQTGGRGAVGTISTETPSNASWKHVRINGLLGNYTNVKAGSYTQYGDAALNTRVSPAIGADHATFKTAFKANFAIIGTPNPAFGDITTDDGKAGVLGLKKVTGVATDNKWTRTNDAGVIDNCRPARDDF
jgi:hypothetical protein